MSHEKFGFSAVKPRHIEYDKNDRTLFYLLRRREPSISICFSCGSCSATCPANAQTPFSFSRIMLYIRRGEKMQIAREINKCMLCGKCRLVCPKGVNTRNIIMITRDFLQKKGT